MSVTCNLTLSRSRCASWTLDRANYTPEDVSPGDLSDHRRVSRTATSDGLIGVAKNYRTGRPDSPEYALKDGEFNRPARVLSRVGERRSFRFYAVPEHLADEQLRSDSAIY